MNHSNENEQDVLESLDEAVCEDRQQQKSHRIFVFYIIGLFFVALVLILVSYIMQEHANIQLESLGTQLSEQSDAAQGAQVRADQLQQTVNVLEEELQQAQEEKEELEQQTDQADALNDLWKLERAYQLGEVVTAQSIIERMDQAYTRETLTDPNTMPLLDEAAEEYERICEELADE